MQSFTVFETESVRRIANRPRLIRSIIWFSSAARNEALAPIRSDLIELGNAPRKEILVVRLEVSIFHAAFPFQVISTHRAKRS